jgi:type IV fimbrial biogenesis protein FimT
LEQVMRIRMVRWQRAFTLIEMLIVIVIAGVVLALAVPSFRQFVLTQRLKSINSQLVTDLQLARSEATSRNAYVRFSHNSNAQFTCYTIYTFTSNESRCDCLESPACTVAGAVDVRSVQVRRDLGVAIELPSGQVTDFDFDPATGGIRAIPTDRGTPALPFFELQSKVDDSRTFKTTVGQSGRLSVCTPTGSALGGPTC